MRKLITIGVLATALVTGGCNTEPCDPDIEDCSSDIDVDYDGGYDGKNKNGYGNKGGGGYKGGGGGYKGGGGGGRR